MILEPIMHVEVSAPSEYQGDLIGQVTRRNGLLQSTNEMDNYFVANAEVRFASFFFFFFQIAHSCLCDESLIALSSTFTDPPQ